MDSVLRQDRCDMLKALYDFEATFPKTISFSEGDFFYLYQTKAKERNWWQVVDSTGHLGFVPSNYVAKEQVEADFFLGFINNVITILSEVEPLPVDKQEIIHRLQEKKKELNTGMHVGKKAQAPKPPSRFDGTTSVGTSNNTTPTHDLRLDLVDSTAELVSDPNAGEHSHHKPLAHEESKKAILHHSCHRVEVEHVKTDTLASNGTVLGPNAVYELVQSVRKETQLSHEMSKVAVETVLISLRDFLPKGAACSIIDALLLEANSNVTCPKDAIACTPDALRLQSALNALASATNDSQQRGWALHDDAHDIQTQLLELISVMSNADISISQYILSLDHYTYVTTLVKFYQMETRWPIRQHLLQAFGVMCGLDRTALATLATSQLPAEIARDMRENGSSVPRLSHSALLLSMVLSMGDKLPITHFEQLGHEFATFLLDLIESPPETDLDEQIPDLSLTLLLAYNLQFHGAEPNLLMDAMMHRNQAKTFTEKVLLLLNREEDPVRIFDHEPAPPHSVLKLVIDLFSATATADLFYTNDVKVMIDIIVRQLADLSAGDQRRQQYLQLCLGVLSHTEYHTHTHRAPDLLRCFSRIFCEEGQASQADQAAVRHISNAFPQYFKA